MCVTAVINRIFISFSAFHIGTFRTFKYSLEHDTSVKHQLLELIVQNTMSSLSVLGPSFQQDCKFDKYVKSKLGKANKCLYVIRSLRKEGCNQLEVDF